MLIPSPLSTAVSICIGHLRLPTNKQTNHGVGGLNNRHVFSHCSSNWTPKSRVLVWLVWGRALFLACRQLPYSHISSHVVAERRRGRRQTERDLFCLLKGNSPIRFGPIVTSSEPYYLLKILSPDIVTFGVRVSTYEF